MNSFSSFDKKIKKFNYSIRIKNNTKKKNNISFDNNIVNIYLNKIGIEHKSEYEKNKEKKMFKSFFQKIHDYSIIQKENKKNYFSKLRGFKNSEEGEQIKEKRKQRAQKIIALKKKRDILEKSKSFPIYKEIYTSLIPYLNIEKVKDKTKKGYLTDRTNNSKLSLSNNIKNINNNSIFIPTLPIIDKIDNSKKFTSLETSNTNRILNISNYNINTNRDGKIDRNQINILNNKFNRKKISFLSNSKKKYIRIIDKYSSINKSNDISHDKGNVTPIKNINLAKLNSKINIYNNKCIKRSKSILNNGLSAKTPNKLYKYQKKSINFDKMYGKFDKKSNKIKFMEINGIKNYFPNYNSIFTDNKKSFVCYGKNKKVKLKNIKINSTRKLISNLNNLLNSSINSYKVMDIIAIDKQKKKEIIINKLKEKFGNYYELAYQIKNNKFNDKKK